MARYEYATVEFQENSGRISYFYGQGDDLPMRAEQMLGTSAVNRKNSSHIRVHLKGDTTMEGVLSFMGNEGWRVAGSTWDPIHHHWKFIMEKTILT